MAVSTMNEPMASRRGPPGDPVFFKRVLSALILGPAALALVFAGGFAFAIPVAVFAAAMGWEWVRMSDPGAPPRAYVLATGTAAGAVLLTAQDAYFWTLLWIAGGALGAALDARVRGLGLTAPAGVAYVAGAAAALTFLRIGEAGGLTPVLFLLAVVWAADVFAYLAGSWIGGWKLLPAASPNKTWAGLAAGLLFGVLAGTGAGYAAGINPAAAGLAALPVAAAAIAGDLIMSLAKRRFGVKDAGTLIPGHGGVLDRVDALMLAALLAAAWSVTGPGGWPGAGS